MRYDQGIRGKPLNPIPPMTKPSFETLPYELSHGRSPKGRGSWAFCPFHKRNAHDYLDWTVFSPSMTFSEAKRWAISQELLQGAPVIAVLP